VVNVNGYNIPAIEGVWCDLASSTCWVRWQRSKMLLARRRCRWRRSLARSMTADPWAKKLGSGSGMLPNGSGIPPTALLEAW